MCGFAGVYAYGERAPHVDRAELLRIRDHMQRRGPDGEGLWVADDGRIGLAHRRLAIIDLSATGAQPMASADGRYHVTFNGETYNRTAAKAPTRADAIVVLGGDVRLVVGRRLVARRESGAFVITEYIKLAYYIIKR